MDRPSSVSSSKLLNDPLEINQKVDDTVVSGLFSDDLDDTTSEEQLDKLFKQQIERIFISWKEDEQGEQDKPDVVENTPNLGAPLGVDCSLDTSS